MSRRLPSVPDLDVDLWSIIFEHLPVGDRQSMCLSKGLRWYEMITHLSVDNQNVDMIQHILDKKQVHVDSIHTYELNDNKLDGLIPYMENLKTLKLEQRQTENTVDLKVVHKLLQHHSSLTNLSLPDCSIGDDGLTSILQMLQENKLKSLDLSSNDIGAKGAVEIGKALVGSLSSLTSLNLGVNNLTDFGDEMFGIFVISQALKDNDSLMVNGQIGPEGGKAIGYALKVSSLTDLNLQSNDIGSEGGKVIAEALKVNGSLTSLDLYENVIGGYYIGEYYSTCHLISTPEGPEAIAEALKVNGSLRSLDLSWNNINADGAKPLAEALHINGSLTSLDLSANQLCGLWRDWSDGGKVKGTYTAEGITALSEAIKVNSLTSLSLLANLFDDVTVEMLLKLKEEKPTLTTLCGLKPDQTEADFAGWGLTPQDAKLLAPEILVMGSLTRLDVKMNRLGEEGKAVLREAIDGRFGCEL